MNFYRNNKITISLSLFFFDNNLIYQKILLSDIRFIRIETLNEKKKNSQKETEDIVDETQAKNVGN